MTLEEILAIPGNRGVYERLQKRLADRSAIAFLGAGTSFPLYPLWVELLERLAGEAITRGLANDADKAAWLRMKSPVQVAAQIRRTLGDSLYKAFLYQAFKDRTGGDGSAYTPAQAALASCTFQGWITTNYDPGLTEARRVLRPDIRDTGFTVWNQTFPMQRWTSGDVFKAPGAYPVLFAHGHFADPASIVLDRESYQKAYRQGPYRRFIENVWLQQELVFVGFSFNDPTLSQIAEDVLSQLAARAEPRHIAIIGLDSDQLYTPEMRREYLDLYHAEALFYPVTKTADGKPDHSALQILLESLIAVPETKPAPPAPTKTLPIRFVHETTDDAKFTGRAEALARLDRWAADPKVRLIAISAIGGLGKTALVGHWLRGGRHRRDAAFFWSFYRERDPKEFFEALEKFRREFPGRATIVLDGLEVIQELPGSTAYGKLLEMQVSEFLHSHCRAKTGDLVVLTSRFPFPDMTPYLGGALRSLALTSLEPSEGATLLESLGVRGSLEDRERISRDLSGHPLALRVFARSMPSDLHGDPTRLWSRIFEPANLSPDDPLETKMRHLLSFYERCLPKNHRRALGLIALFRAPVGRTTLLPLWEKLLEQPEATLNEALHSLYRDHLLTADPGLNNEPLYSCHPIFRDHFRSDILKRPDFGPEAANILAGPPDAKAKSIADVQLVATAIELLLEAGDYRAADDLYKARLQRGFIFELIPAPNLGVEVAGAFLLGQRRELVESRLGQGRLGFYLNELAGFSLLAGEPERALQIFSELNAICRAQNDKKNLLTNLQNVIAVRLSLGLFPVTERNSAEALALAMAQANNREGVSSLAHHAYSAFMQGNIVLADREFTEANATEKRITPGLDDLYSQRGLEWAEYLARTGNNQKSRDLTLKNLKICNDNSWTHVVARCHWMLGWLDSLHGAYAEAHTHLDGAKSVFHIGNLIFDLARTLVTESACYLAERNFDSALASCERALELAMPRSYSLVHADALNARARIALAKPDPDPNAALDDAEAALQLAEGPECEYAWGQLDACEILARAYRALGNKEESIRYAKLAEDWNRRLTLPEPTAVPQTLN